MALTETLSESAQDRILTVLCDRNQSVDLVYVRTDGTTVSAKVRLLGRETQEILITLPVVDGHPVPLREGESIGIYFLWEKQRFTFSSRVIDRRRWSPSRGSSIPALAIQVPDGLRRAQRRECFRLSTLHLPTAVATVRIVNSNRKPLQGVLADVSETGCALLVNCSNAEVFARGQTLTVTFSLPDLPEPLEITGDLRWHAFEEEDQRVRVGVQWDLDLSRKLDRQIQELLGRAIMEEQRRMLRRLAESRGE
jgi:c-di-GMP-binding flagellar brake protein YcgR